MTTVPFVSRFQSLRRLLGAAAVMGIVFALSPQRVAYGASITVDTTADENAAAADNGACALREAIQAANTNLAVDSCAAGSPGATDTITLADGATYTLTTSGTGENAASTGDLDIVDNGNSP